MINDQLNLVKEEISILLEIILSDEELVKAFVRTNADPYYIERRLRNNKSRLERFLKRKQEIENVNN